MASRVSSFITVNLQLSDRAKADAIFLVIPVGKRGYASSSRDFFTGLGALPLALVVALGSHAETSLLGLFGERLLVRK